MIRLVLLGALIIAAVAAGPTSGRAQASGGGPALRVQWEADQGGYTKVHYRSHRALVGSPYRAP